MLVLLLSLLFLIIIITCYYYDQYYYQIIISWLLLELLLLLFLYVCNICVCNIVKLCIMAWCGKHMQRESSHRVDSFQRKLQSHHQIRHGIEKKTSNGLGPLVIDIFKDTQRSNVGIRL